MLETLQQARLVWASHVPDLARTDRLGSHPPHTHVGCRRRGRLAALPGVGPALNVAAPDGFTVEHVQVTAIGLGARCAARDA